MNAMKTHDEIEEYLSKRLKVKATIEVSQNDLWSLLISAFEGGSTYWAFVADYNRPDGTEYLHLSPFIEGGWIDLCDNEEWYASKDPENDASIKRYRLDMAAIERGIQVMAEKCPAHFASLIEENADAETGDVFLQCCLFGEVVYG